MDDESGREFMAKFLGDIDQVDKLSDDLAQLADDLTDGNKYADFKLVINKRPFYVNKEILAARSPYFRQLIAQSSENTLDVQLPKLSDVNNGAFDAFLRYVYTGKMSLLMARPAIFDVLLLAELFSMSELQHSIVFYLETTISADTVCALFEAASVYAQTSLSAKCANYIEKHFSRLVEMRTPLNQLTFKSFTNLINKESLGLKQVE